MGTSISQPSPRNTNWSPVYAGYQNKFIPENRIISEVWRASENEAIPISKSLKSDSIFECYSAVQNSKTYSEAIEKINKSTSVNKNNNLIVEFAKRIIPAAYLSDKPSKDWKSRFFSEVTNYVISRDTCGFVGDKYRNKSVTELITFKKNIYGKVADIINKDKSGIKSKSEWKTFIDKSIKELKSHK